MSTSAAPFPPTWASLLDDAATFPPGDADLGDALAAHVEHVEHVEHRQAWYAGLVCSFVAKDSDLPRVLDAGVPVSIIATGGAGAVS